MPSYAELAVTTNFSFLRGASHPQEYVAQAAALGLKAIGIADRNTMAGVVRAYSEWKNQESLKLLVGARLVTTDGFETIAYPIDRDGLWEALQAPEPGQPAHQEGPVPSRLRRNPRGERGADLHRHAAAAARQELCRETCRA